MWSPNLQVVDYVTWSAIQQRVYETRVHDADETASTVCVVQLGAVAD